MTQIECVDLLERVKELLIKDYNIEYVGHGKIYKKDLNYQFNLVHLSIVRPLVFIKECNTDDEFFEFLKKEFINRNIKKLKYTSSKKLYDERTAITV